MCCRRRSETGGSKQHTHIAQRLSTAYQVEIVVKDVQRIATPVNGRIGPPHIDVVPDAGPQGLVPVMIVQVRNPEGRNFSMV